MPLIPCRHAVLHLLFLHLILLHQPLSTITGQDLSFLEKAAELADSTAGTYEIDIPSPNLMASVHESYIF